MENVKTFQNGKNTVRVTFNVGTPASELPPDVACRMVTGKPSWLIADEIAKKQEEDHLRKLRTERERKEA